MKCLPYLEFESVETIQLQEKISSLENELKMLKKEIE